ncbi:hypothetical protein SAMN04489844_3411 [Nocardioides exalbidus]|uniref:Uncharacterized protein n=1 Tax=Nocardioides exalbidus TaxID=402596 RepID=A0A1H4WZX4_9ACTN|nr:hypothetical protein [Nocardioides exalbidus]SEC98887.1 hypothetical protein SAMN04489844_3411 [Nocardioides exalbidus]
MGIRPVRVVVGVLLVASGALMFAASRQRWASACPYGGSPDTPACEVRQDHRFDVVVPSDPWTPIGTSAQQAGWSLLVLASAMLLLPFALAAGRAAVGWGLGAVVAAGGIADIGQATLRSGLAGRPIAPLTESGSLLWWCLVPTVLLVGLLWKSRGWPRAGAAFVLLGSPFVAALTYGIGSFDAAPWWEAYSGTFTALGGLCLLVAGARPARQSREAVRTSPATPVDVL